MRRLLFASVGATLLVPTIMPHLAEAALICKSGHLHYAGSGFYANRLQAEASAIQAWRHIKADTHGATRAASINRSISNCTFFLTLGIGHDSSAA